MKLSIIIVNFNTSKLLLQTLESITKRREQEIIVVDNGSQDSSVNLVKKNYPEVRIIENKENLGFSQANNQGIKISKGNTILLLNSDTIILNNAIEVMIKFLHQSQATGVVSGTLLNKDKSIQVQGGYLPNLLNIFAWMFFIDDLPLIQNFIKPYQLGKVNAFTKELSMGWVAGTAMMIRRQVIEKVGYLDEKIFMYGEDVDFCIRAKKAGFSIKITPKAKIIHLGSQSSQGDQSNAILGEYKSIKYIFEKHKPVWQRKIILFLLKSGAVLRMFVFGILLGRKQTYEIYKKAYQSV